MPASGNTNHGREIDRAGWKTDQLPMESGYEYSTGLLDGNHPDRNLKTVSAYRSTTASRSRCSVLLQLLNSIEAHIRQLICRHFDLDLHTVSIRGHSASVFSALFFRPPAVAAALGRSSAWETPS